MTSKPSTLFLIPHPLADAALATLPEEVKKTAMAIKHYFVENIRTARRYLKSIDPAVCIDDIAFSEIGKHHAPDVQRLEEWLSLGVDVGVMSEAGCPGVADPGSEIVAHAQSLGVQVRAFVGPNALLLALMASGLNGQRFRFLGYLPIEAGERRRAIREMESSSAKAMETQIFIETPYRNNQLLDELLRICQPQTLLCLASDLTHPEREQVRTKTIAQWKKAKPDLHKRPSVFLLLS